MEGSLGQRLKSYIKKSSYKQTEIAKELNVKEQTVSDWVRNRSKPNTYNLIALKKMMPFISIDYLLFGSEEKGEKMESSSHFESDLIESQRQHIETQQELIEELKKQIPKSD